MSDFIIGRMILSIAQTNCYFICLEGDEGEKEAIVIDPADRGEYIYEKLTEKGLKVTGILLTHGHFDHIWGAEKLRQLSGAKIYANIAEKEVCEDACKNVSADVGREYTVVADKYLHDGDELTMAGMTLRMIATPGHTIGGACFYFPDENILFSGDTLFQESVGRTDFPTGSMSTLVSSIREKLFTLPDETKIYPGHGEPTTIANEKEYNPFVS
jgi:glyoxylase-like metal-dependent hydrolase (beta-lactamase superfamily II)